MKKEAKQSKSIEQAKKKLGKELFELRKDRFTQRELAKKVDTPNTTLKYIEDGVNAPAHDLYNRLINALSPSQKQRKKLDNYFAIIRGTPPPDVCKIVIQNDGLTEAIRLFGETKLTQEQITSVKTLFEKIAEENNKGDIQNETV